MRNPDDALICAELNPAEQDVCRDMRASLGLTTDADLVRLGLWHLARHCDIPVGSEVFGLRRATRKASA